MKAAPLADAPLAGRALVLRSIESRTPRPRGTTSTGRWYASHASEP